MQRGSQLEQNHPFQGGFTQSKADPAAYGESAKHRDFTWFEMQHSTFEFRDIEAMIGPARRLRPRR